MKPLIPLLVVALSAPCHAMIVITEVMSSSAHAGGSNNGDWFEITNTGPTTVDVTGWSWDDNSFTPGVSNFGSLTGIQPGQSVIISEEPPGGETAWLSNWGVTGLTVINLDNTVFVGLGGGGDAVAIYDAANTLVTSVTFGAATAGRSFEWGTNGSPLGLSIIGENGAFLSLSNGQNTGNGPGVDVGSPGLAFVPEPGASLLSGIAGLGFLARRRRS